MDFPEDLEFCQILVLLTPHLPKTKDVIQVIAEELKRRSIINWGNFRLLLSELYEYNFGNRNACGSPNREKFVKFIFSVLRVFYNHKCSDVSIIADVLELLYLVICNSFHMINEAFQMGIRFNDNNRPKSISVFEKMLVSSYKDSSSLFIIFMANKSVYWNWVKILTTSGLPNILMHIIFFGATLIAPQDVAFEHEKVSRTMMLLFGSGTRAELKSFRYRVLQNLKSEFNEGSRKRLFFINAVVEILLKDDFHIATDHYIQCCRIIVEATPEPLITSNEIKNYITKLCSGIIFNEKLQEFLEKYESYFPDGREVSTPRSLSHLGRFQVRESLRTARSFPYGVEELDLPKKIKDYICFKDMLLF